MKSVEVEDVHHDEPAQQPFYNQVWFNGGAFVLTVILILASVGFICTILFTAHHLSDECGASLSMLPIFIFCCAAVSLSVLAVFFGQRSFCTSEKVNNKEQEFMSLNIHAQRVDQQLVFECFKQSCLFFFVVLGALSFVLMTLYFFAWSAIFFGSTSLRSGGLNLDSLKDKAMVKRDQYGIPHIECKTEQDMWYVQGVVQAQERLWQLELQRRLAQGRLSEVFGKDSLPLDRTSRTLGFMRLANSTFWNLKPSTRAIITSFVKGINEYVASSERSLPIEYNLFFFKPEPFTEVDIIANSKMIAWQMGENHRDEYERYQLLQKGLNVAKVLSFFPDVANLGPTVLTNLEANMTGLTQQQLDDNERRFKDNTGAFVPKNITTDVLTPKDLSDILKFKPQASNSWVIGGKYTASGLPLLANDPHLGFGSPSPLLMMHLNFGSQEIIGASFVGLPGIVSGRTDNFTWGITSNPADISDYFVINDINKDTYNYKGVITRFITRTERIKVKRQPDVLVTIKETVYGPVMNEAFDIKGPNSLAMKWTGQELFDSSVEAFVSIWKSQDYFDFRNYFAGYVGPSFNVLYADRDDNFGYFVAGRLPVRKQGHSGQVPVNGNGDYDYNGYVGTLSLPTVVNTPRGFIVSANNRPTPKGHPILMNNDYPYPYRAKRITDLIQGFIDRNQKMTIANMITIQNDVKSEIFTRLKPILQQMPVLGVKYELLRQNLINWDGTENVNGRNREATIFEAWFMDLGRIVGSEKRYSRNPEYILQAVNKLIPGEDCSKLDIRGVTSCLQYAQRKLEIVIDNLISKYGAIPRWGQDIHKSVFPNQILSGSPLQCLSDSEVFTPGGTDTVFENVPIGNDSRIFPLNSQFGPVYKQIVDLNITENSLFIGAPGQSGNLLGYNYHDLMERWATGARSPSSSGYIPMQTQLYNLPGAKDIKEKLYLKPSD